MWFTLSHGIFNEIYYPSIDQACVRDLGLLVSDGSTFFSEEKRDAVSRVDWAAPGVPAFRVVNTSRDGRYRITKHIVADPYRDTVLQQTKFDALDGRSDYQVYALLAPHLANGGGDNSAWVGDYKGVPMLFAARGGTCLALACTPGWKRGSTGFVGVSDGWHDVSRNKTMTWTYPRAENGNVALTGEVDLAASDGSFLIALAFGTTPAEAGHRARASLLAGFRPAFDTYVRDWQQWQQRLDDLVAPKSGNSRSVRTSAAVLRCHEEKSVPGAMIASLSIPWGDTKGDEDLGGYHLVWPRDLVESAGGLIAVGAHADARRILDYLRVTQSADGSWPQNMWVSGESYWHGIQLDETAFPILLVDLLNRNGHLDADARRLFWPMIRDAARFLVANGPSSQQDRWEENAGLSPFTVAAEVAALLVAADAAERHEEPALSHYLRDTADAWNDSIDPCLYVQQTTIARDAGVDGYYVRVAPPETADAASPAGGFVPIKNRPWPSADVPASEIVSPDALALVRFGLRAPDDPRIVNTVRVLDATLCVDLPQGPGWRRYTGDGYGEHADGSAFDGTGIGRVWPLLTGERAHYELAAGHRDEAERLLATLEASAGDGGLLPEQTWDAADVPARELFFGRPSGSAMPLVWAHAEHVKLARSLRDGRIFDMPQQAHQRYVVDRIRARVAIWRRDRRPKTIAPGLILRIDEAAPCLIHWTSDGWATSQDVLSIDTGIGRHFVDLPTDTCADGATIIFTCRWQISGQWDNENFTVRLGIR